MTRRRGGDGRDEHQALEKLARLVGAHLAPGRGFALLVWDQVEGERRARYVSNAAPGVVSQVLLETACRLDARAGAQEQD